MILKYKTYPNGVLFGACPLNGYNLMVFARRLKEALVFVPRKVTKKTYERVFGTSEEIKLSDEEKSKLGNLYETITGFGDWKPREYQGEESEIIIKDINDFFREITEIHAEKFHLKR